MPIIGNCRRISVPGLSLPFEFTGKLWSENKLSFSYVTNNASPAILSAASARSEPKIDCRWSWKKVFWFLRKFWSTPGSEAQCCWWRRRISGQPSPVRLPGWLNLDHDTIWGHDIQIRPLSGFFWQHVVRNLRLPDVGVQVSAIKKFQIAKHKYQTNHNDRNSKFQTWWNCKKSF